MKATETITEAFEHSGLKILIGSDMDFGWQVEYNGKKFYIGQSDNTSDWTPRYHITDLQTGEKLCTRANYRKAMQLIKNR